MMKKSYLRYVLMVLMGLIGLTGFVACNDDEAGDDEVVASGEDLRVYDGQVYEIQKASKGKGINIVMLGDGFTISDIVGGTYEEVMRKSADYLFALEPMRSLREYFNVYYITAVSMSNSLEGRTAMGCGLQDNGVVGYPSGEVMAQKAMEYVKKLPNFDRNNTIGSVVLNSLDYGGVTYYPFHAGETANYNEMLAVAFTSFHDDGIDGVKFRNVIQHETIGHGLAKLADEYYYSGTEYATAPSAYSRYVYNFYWTYYWYYNISGTSSIASSPVPHIWEPFISDPDYADEALGFYTGAAYYQSGYWRPTDTSIMRNTDSEGAAFNAPSRYAIYLHTMRAAEGYIPTVEEFKAFDKQHRN